MEQSRHTNQKFRVIAVISAIAVCICVGAAVLLRTVILPGRNYRAALELYRSGDLDGAIAALKALDGYRDSEALLADFLRSKYGEEAWNAFQKIKIGDIYTFGTYEQDNDPSNGKEAIEWVVLDKDGMSLLLLSKQGLDCRQYYERAVPIGGWNSCTLRQMLNGTFLNEAFSSEEDQRMLQKTTVSADRNPRHSTKPGNSTEDFVFLLSIRELKKYTASKSERQCFPTEAAIADGAYSGGDGCCWWWLRSPGITSNHAAFVSDDGAIRYGGHSITDTFTCVRPALWLNLEPAEAAAGMDTASSTEN